MKMLLRQHVRNKYRKNISASSETQVLSGLLKQTRLLGSWSKTAAGSRKPRVYGRCWGCTGYPPAHPCEPRNGRDATPWDRTKGWERTAIPETGCALNICVASAQWSPGDKAGCITLGSNNRTGSEPELCQPGEVWGLGMRRESSTLGLPSISVQFVLKSVSKIKPSPGVFPQGTVPALWAVGHWGLWGVQLPQQGWSPACSPSAAVPAALTDNPTAEHPRTERACTTHMAEYRKKTKGNLAKKCIYFSEDDGGYKEQVIQVIL